MYALWHRGRDHCCGAQQPAPGRQGQVYQSPRLPGGVTVLHLPCKSGSRFQNDKARAGRDVGGSPSENRGLAVRDGSLDGSIRMSYKSNCQSPWHVLIPPSSGSLRQSPQVLAPDPRPRPPGVTFLQSLFPLSLLIVPTIIARCITGEMA